MTNAIIKDNIPYCTKCNNKINGGIVEYNLVESNGEKFLAYDSKCGHCKEVHRYYTDMQFEKRCILNNVQIIR